MSTGDCPVRIRASAATRVIFAFLYLMLLIAGIGTLASAAEAAAATRAVLTVLGALEVLAAGYLGWRALFRQAVLASPDSIVVQNRFRTHRVSASDISALTFAKKPGRYGTYWVARVLLLNGSVIWIIVIGGTSTQRPVPSRARQQVMELASCLGVPVTPVTSHV